MSGAEEGGGRPTGPWRGILDGAWNVLCRIGGVAVGLLMGDLPLGPMGRGGSAGAAPPDSAPPTLLQMAPGDPPVPEERAAALPPRPRDAGKGGAPGGT